MINIIKNSIAAIFFCGDSCGNFDASFGRFSGMKKGPVLSGPSSWERVTLAEAILGSGAITQLYQFLFITEILQTAFDHVLAEAGAHSGNLPLG